jgi:hypothetical protein
MRLSGIEKAGFALHLPGEAMVRLMVEAVRTAAAIPVRAAIAAGEGHDPSLSRSGSF